MDKVINGDNGKKVYLYGPKGYDISEAERVKILNKAIALMILAMGFYTLAIIV